MYRNDFRRWINLRQRIRDRLLPRIATVNDARRPAHPAFKPCPAGHNIVTARRDEKVRDGGACGEPSKRKNNERHAIQSRNCLG